jgi:thymidine kinase
MFSGKTEELIRRLNRAIIAKQSVEIYKPRLDHRFGKDQVVSHNKRSIRSTEVDFAEDILFQSGHCHVVGIDEIQFFDQNIVSICEKLANNGKRVIAAGLDMDYHGRPFGPVPQLLSIAEYVHKMHAICVVCGNIANYSYRHTDDNGQVLIGEKDIYEPRCRKCYMDGIKNVD